MNAGVPEDRAGRLHRRRVVIVAPPLNAISGISTHARLLLASTLRDEFHLLHFSAGGEGLNETIGRRLIRLLAGPVRLARVLRRFKPSLVHVNTALNFRAFARDAITLLVCRSCGRPVVMQFHGGDHLNTSLYRDDHQLRIILLRRILGMAACLVVISHEDTQFYGALVSRAKIVRIANAVAAPEGPPRAFPGECLRLLYMGRLIEPKGLLDVLDALAVLKRMGLGNRLSLAVAGTGPLQQAAQARVRAHALHSMVHFLGAVFGPDKEALLASSDLLLLPTYHAERLPYALLEGMAAGLPPVTCATGAIPDVVHHGQEGVIVKPRDPAGLALALAELLTDRDKLARMSLACREVVLDRYSVERMAAEFRALYAGVFADENL